MNGLNFENVELVRDAIMNQNGVSILTTAEYDLLCNLEGMSDDDFYHCLVTYRKMLHYFLLNRGSVPNVDLLLEVLNVKKKIQDMSLLQ